MFWKRPGPRGFDLPGLGTQQAADDLQVVLHPVMNLLEQGGFLQGRLDRRLGLFTFGDVIERDNESVCQESGVKLANAYRTIAAGNPDILQC